MQQSEGGGAAGRAGVWRGGGCIEFPSEERMGNSQIVETWFLVGCSKEEWQ